MKYKKINGTNLSSSAVILGTDGIGSVISEKESFNILDNFCCLGGNHIDTANIYGYPTSESEKTIGKWLKSHGGREHLVIATKGAHPNLKTMDIPRLSEKEIRYDLENSLKNLGTDYIDLYWLHRDCEDLSCEEIIETLNKFVREGKIREFGASNWKGKRIKQANEYAVKNGLKPFCASQIKWSYATVSSSYEEDKTLVLMDKTEYEFYKDAELSVMAYASQAKGFFTKLYTMGEEGLSPKAMQRYMCGDNINRYNIAGDIAKKLGISITDVILNYLLKQEINTFPIIGCKNTQQLQDSMTSTEADIPEEDIKTLLAEGNKF